MTRAARAQAAAYSLGWAGVRRLPGRATYRAADLAARIATRRGGKGVSRLRSNLSRVDPELDEAGLDELVLAGMRSYLRYYVDSFRLPGLSRADIVRAVRVEGDAPVREELEAGRGVVMGLAHQGNWDLAGAWGVVELGAIVTVAERLEPPEAFEAFLTFRERLGMTILALGDDGVFQDLVRAVRGGAVVPLLMDRDLSHTGIEVTLAGHSAMLARGPAMLASVTRCLLVPVSTWYEPVPPEGDDVFGSGRRLVVTFHPAVDVPGDLPADERVRAATQGCADALGRGIAQHPEDWHMLQRVFTADLDPGRVP